MFCLVTTLESEAEFKRNVRHSSYQEAKAYEVVSHTNQWYLLFVLDNKKLIWMHPLSSRMDHTPFQLPITLWTKASLFHIKFHGFLVNNTIVSDSSICSTLLLLLLEPLFWYLRTIVIIYNSQSDNQLELCHTHALPSEFFFIWKLQPYGT